MRISTILCLVCAISLTACTPNSDPDAKRDEAVSSPSNAPASKQAGYRMLGAIIPVDGELHFIKATGPQVTIAAHAIASSCSSDP